MKLLSIIDNTTNEANIKNNLTKITNRQKKSQENYSLENLFDAFDTGLPCKSNLLDLSHISDTILKNKAPKVMVNFCQVIIRNIFNVTNKYVLNYM